MSSHPLIGTNLAAFVQGDDQQPADRFFRLWVQSPNGTWLLLDGGWAREHRAVQFAINAGYTMIPEEIGVHNVETQMREAVDGHRPILHAVRRIH